jgi:tetratricopeptide (TPR) repeat protein
MSWSRTLITAVRNTLRSSALVCRWSPEQSPLSRWTGIGVSRFRFGAHCEKGVKMEYKLKQISTSGIAEAIAKAELYRSLNEPEEAESICRDILVVDPQHQFAWRLLGLALTDQFAGGGADRFREAEEIFQLLTDPYERRYYTGILYERRAKAQIKSGQTPPAVMTLFEMALHSFAEAEKIRPAGNDDAILRWNRCVRLLQNLTDGWEGLELEGVVFDAMDTPPR